MILKEIHQSVETITGQPLSTIENKKLFCGLVRKHDTTVSQHQIAKYLQVPLSNISYYLKQHTILSKNVGYNYIFKKIESDLIQRCKPF